MGEQIDLEEYDGGHLKLDVIGIFVDLITHLPSHHFVPKVFVLLRQEDITSLINVKFFVAIFVKVSHDALGLMVSDQLTVLPQKAYDLGMTN